MTDIVINIAAKVGEYLVSPIGRQLRYLFCYRSYTDDLNNKVQELGRVSDDLQRTVGDETKRAGYEIRPIVQEWLNRVDRITEEAEELMKDENKSCFNGWCPNFKSRYLLGRKAEEKAQEIVQIQKEGNFPHGVSDRVPLRNLTFKNYEPFESRASILNKIMDAFGDDEIKMVGVWGMGGVGKTTLVKQIAEQAKQGKLFTTEVYIDVSWTRDLEKPQQGIAKIQQKIAEMLHLEFTGKDESTRAVELNHRLKKEKILIILDDIWKEIDLEEVGIPCKDDPTECKVVLTSRDLHLIRQYMDAETCFLIQQLPRKEAWSLFNKTSGGSLEKNLDLRPIATDVVEECEGLPIAIVTIAKALKSKNVAVWKNALKELRTSAPTNIQGVEEKVYSCLELSYNHLESDEVKSLFLLCGLLGDGDISLDDLLKYGMDLDLFDYIDALEQARNKLLTLVEILKASSLLLEVEDGSYREAPSLVFVEEGNGFVRMHDVVRDVAKAIASKDPHHRFVVKEDVRLQEWEKRDGELRNCTGISLKCTHVHELPEGLVCPKLGFFLLNGNDNFLKIPDTFFKEMKEVRVLSLFRIDLTQLPSSLHFLSNLRTLCLHRCRTLKDITIIGELKKLQILSLVDCGILVFPKERMQLTDLRMLNLVDSRILGPRNVISSLSRLEYLCMRIILWGSEGVDGGRRNASLSELKHLSCLRALQLQLSHSCLPSEDVSFENLTRYDISIGSRPGHYGEKKTSRRLKLYKIKGSDMVKCFSKLLKTTEVLALGRLRDTKHFVYELDCDGFPQLKYLYISRSDGMQYIMNTMEMEWVDPPHSAFPLLEGLKLRCLKQLEAVCHGPIPMGCFANLRDLIIEECNSLKYIIWLPTTQARESVLVFPQLGSLKLERLPNLINFYSTGTSGSQEPCSSFFNQVALPGLELLYLVSMDNVKTVWDNQDPVCSSSKLKDLYLKGCKNLLIVFPSNFLEGIQSLQTLNIENCCSLKEIFEVGEIYKVESNGIVVPPLRDMCLHGQNMESVRKDSRGYLAFQSLNSLKVGNCASLKYLLPTSVAKGLVQLEVLEIFDCGVEELVANENGLEEVPIFLFPRLTSLKLTKLYQLKRLYLDKYSLGCPLLKTLAVCNCDEVELLLQEKSLESEVDKQPLFLMEKNTFPNVEELKLGFKGPMEILLSQFSRESFGKLRVLEIKACHDVLVVIPSSKLQVLHNLKQLIVRNCSSVKEVIQVEGRVGETLPQLTIMYLENLPMLTHLSGFGPFLQNLHSLQVSKCGKLINLVSPSMAKTLVQLEELTVSYCDEVKEIVENEGGEATDDKIVFTKLKKLKLHFLPNLKSFCSARYTFIFPCLTEMQVKRCPEMEIFCKGDSITQRLEKVLMSDHRPCWEIDLNTTIQKMFMETHPKEEDSKEEIPDEENAEEWNSKEQHPKVQDSVEEDTKEEDSERGESGSLEQRSS